MVFMPPLAYDAVVINVASIINVSIVRVGPNMNVSWTGGAAPYVVQRTGALPAGSWSDVITTSFQSTNLPFTNSTGFFRVKGQ